jgi:hypothetical protein
VEKLLRTRSQNPPETGNGPNVSDEAREKLRKALEKAGVEFIAENGGGAGVRLKKRGGKR